MDELIPWLRLSLVNGLGPRGQIQLLRALGEPAAILAAPLDVLVQYVPRPLAVEIHANQQRDLPQLSAAIEWVKRTDCAILTLADDRYPKKLLDLPDAPPLLYAMGNLALLDRPAISIVGSRNASAQGIQNAEAFAQHLSLHAITIISGLASGIDAAAHRGGLANTGSSIAIVGTGLDRVYPATNRTLAHELANNGLILSELALGSPPKAEHFPRRNRMIAALGLGCLVVEAALGSGSLITARQAVELGREVFAIPGSIHSPLAKGCHHLIKNGAKLVESGADIFDELAAPLSLFSLPNLTKKPAHSEVVENHSNDPVLSKMGWDPINFDALIELTGLTSEALCAILLGLELEGQLSCLPGNRYQRLAGAVRS
ncbi:DNA-protecting protein DprA [Chitinibacter fontanus]|uniref:DNA-protecting protein DprA n=1 Tax=Chitinibacter fontanus TaxID=1737446 RepID=A0A7D5ZNW8_9NEIS|nr:DNA-processing protein DprA [Chitinibacter fontanus]QLI83250.1 DNA-protecting protein DprA [Chitinibacter fontanus]